MSPPSEKVSPSLSNSRSPSFICRSTEKSLCKFSIRVDSSELSRLSLTEILQYLVTFGFVCIGQAFSHTSEFIHIGEGIRDCSLYYQDISILWIQHTLFTTSSVNTNLWCFQSKLSQIKFIWTFVCKHLHRYILPLSMLNEFLWEEGIGLMWQCTALIIGFSSRNKLISVCSPCLFYIAVPGPLLQSESLLKEGENVGAIIAQVILPLDAFPLWEEGTAMLGQ